MDDPNHDTILAAVRQVASSLGPNAPSPEAILHALSSSRVPNPSSSSLERTLRSLDRNISRFVSSDRLIWSHADESTAFLDSIDDLLATLHDLDSEDNNNNNKALFDRADDLLRRSMLRLEDEFRAILLRPDAPAALSEDDSDVEIDSDSIPVANAVVSFDIIIDALPPGAVADLHSIARRMVSAGFGRECAETYAASRREFVDESVARLGLKTWRNEDEIGAAAWADLEDEIPRWIKAVKMVFLILVPSERRLADRVFATLPPFADLASFHALRAAVLELLTFAAAISASSRSPERLFRLIDMYEAVRDLLPDVEYVLNDQYSSALRSEVAAVYKALGLSIRGVFMELENLIRRDPAKTAIPGGGLHPITRYVLNYLRAACASRSTLEEVMEEDGVPGGQGDPLRSSSPFAVQVAWIMDVLQSNLDAKSKIYREVALSCIFLMNNGRYVIQKVVDSELKPLLGEEWIRKQNTVMRRWMSEYQRLTWSKVVSVLRIDGVGGVVPSSAAAVKVMVDRLRKFNADLDENWRVQGAWVVVDDQLRSELKSQVRELVLPTYRNFIMRIKQMAEAGKQLERHMKYSPEEVDARISELFEGSGKRPM